ncbi:MAG TPA: hypothetical protein VLH41_02365 [Thermoanaerobaculia bacterium]|nr:hypothetical protein [Thermoanaerobaculia bacterium]
MESPKGRLTTRARSRRRALGLMFLAAAAAHGGCEIAPSQISVRILDRYRKTSGAKPLPAGGMIRLRLASGDGAPPAAGNSEILWEPGRYRESVSSAGMTTVRGVESGKAYFTDEDDVTRVASEPVVRELLTRSYFWRRAWLFERREGARLSPGPADDSTVSVTLTPDGGNPLFLVFSRRDGGLVAVRSPRFSLEFSSPREFRDLSDPGGPLRGEIAWTGLPTGPIPSPAVGGGRARFAVPADRVPYERGRGVLIVPARVSGREARLAIDGAADGPLRLTPALAARLPLSFAPDVRGRRVAAGAALEIGAASWPGIFAQETDEVPPGADAAAGGCLFREAVVEIDPGHKRFGVHDPARWVIPEGYFRIVTDDDGNRPVAILYRGSRELRLTAGADVGSAALWLAAESAARLGLPGASQADGLRWGPANLPPLPLRISSGEFFPDWGDDGRLGWTLIERFHAFFDMPNRWTYIRPADLP